MKRIGCEVELGFTTKSFCPLDLVFCYDHIMLSAQKNFISEKCGVFQRGINRTMFFIPIQLLYSIKNVQIDTRTKT